MCLKLSIASSRKVGEPNYGSRGAIVGLEMEVDAGLIHHPRQLHERIRRLFRMAKQSVDLELSGIPPAGRQNGDQNTARRPATARQIRAIQAIAGRQNLDLSEELVRRVGIERPEDLSIVEASQFIDAMKVLTNGATSPK
jgi:hypothetical protein